MKIKNRRYASVAIVLIVFVLIAVALLGQYGLMFKGTEKEQGLPVLDNNAFEIFYSKDGEIQNPVKNPECLYLWDSGNENSVTYYEEMKQIFHDMKVEYTEIDLRKEQTPDFNDYEIVVIGFSNLQDYGNIVLTAVDWMESGGSLFVPQVPETGSVYGFLSSRIGVANYGLGYYKVTGIRIKDEFMLTGGQTEYSIEYPYESALITDLGDECKIHIVSSDEREVPLLWETKRKEGRAVVVNLGHYEKNYRGIYAAAYSLLSDYCVWPVINGSAFYIDGFPFPLPREKSSYVTEEYGEDTDLYSFYVKEWWNDLLTLAEDYDLVYTATMQENNDNDVDAPFESKASPNRYQYFASTLMDIGGELGLYGYNQQPLALGAVEQNKQSFSQGTDESDEPDYEKDLGLSYWKSTSDIAAALKEAVDFKQTIIGGQSMTVYTPPSNIWTQEGLDVLKDTLPDIKAVAGSYFGGGFAREQEFEVNKNGLITTPRITSGGNISDNMRISALSELNFHYVISHYVSPLDVVNQDPGNSLSWRQMEANLREYEEWKRDAAPNIRAVSGTEMAGAVQRFYYLGAEETETEDGLKIDLTNFKDEAWMMVRFNEWTPDEKTVSGGTLEKLSGNLYLLKAEHDTVTIQRKDV